MSNFGFGLLCPFSPRYTRRLWLGIRIFLPKTGQGGLFVSFCLILLNSVIGGIRKTTKGLFDVLKELGLNPCVCRRCSRIVCDLPLPISLKLGEQAFRHRNLSAYREGDLRPLGLRYGVKFMFEVLGGRRYGLLQCIQVRIQIYSSLCNLI